MKKHGVLSKERDSAFLFCVVVLVLVSHLFGQNEVYKFNAYDQKQYTIETNHFRIHYPSGLKQVAAEIGQIGERLYQSYRDIFCLSLPSKTEVIVTDDDAGGSWALALTNTIHIWANDMDWNTRGHTNWLENVVAHEYAHIVSISESFKLPPWIPYIQGGFFSHPNEKNRGEAFHVFPSEILPPWFFEGITQYQSTMHQGDAWDSHRDMILRTLCLSDNMLSWDRMAVFTGRGDDYEKVY
ncbi:MAG: hypothetical protein JW795_05930, partial [Chitinivibrionales bacterium]|nr:hypothetical protein [Chitinivibrionales bacterium]